MMYRKKASRQFHQDCMALTGLLLLLLDVPKTGESTSTADT